MKSHCQHGLRPIENFWGIQKQQVYANNWSAKSREVLVHRIRKLPIRKFDIQVIVKMFDHLKAKVDFAAENGLGSLVK